MNPDWQAQTTSWARARGASFSHRQWTCERTAASCRDSLAAMSASFDAVFEAETWTCCSARHRYLGRTRTAGHRAGARRYRRVKVDFPA
ncbi:MAG: hypothetical protein JWL99_7032 [Streptomyces oryziradicis]|nr:hypothetical protein [Actinacidiphila oryziradicis]